MPLIICDVSLILTWFREYVVTSMEEKVITAGRRDTSPADATFQTQNCMYWLLLHQLKTTKTF